MRHHKKGPWSRVPKSFVEPYVTASAASDELFVISELRRQERLLVGYAGAIGMHSFAWSKFFPRTIVGKLSDSETLWRLELMIPDKMEKNPDAELVAMIYLASIGEQL